MNLLESLLSRGFFPKELPPVFTTRSLGSCIHELPIKYNIKPSKSITFSIPKQKHYRRILHVPHPFHQILLSIEIAKEWEQIYAFCTKSTLTFSYPKVDLSGKRAIDRAYSFQEVMEERLRSSIISKIALFTDISRFYSTIYTHVIPWALHTKELGKKKRRDKKLLGNRLDIGVRNTQEGQTLGIPIGPDTSLVMAELIGCAIDMRLQDKIANIRGLRYVDDFYLFFDTMGEAEQALTTIRETLAYYELDLNAHKTKVFHLPERLYESWKVELDLFKISSKKAEEQRVDFFNLFHKAYELYQKYQNPAIMKYALKKSIPDQLHLENWELYESWLLRIWMDVSNTYPLIVDLFNYYQRKKMPIDQKRITRVLSRSIQECLQYQHDFELVWALWLCKCLNLTLPEQLGQGLSMITNPFVVLLALDLSHLGLLKGLTKERWEQQLTNGWSENDWLLQYEGVQKGWLQGRIEHPFFQHLAKHHVQFYDPMSPFNQVTMASFRSLGYDH
ncbi:RNA-directed DNA polymerase [Thermoflavimicrobium daqui]|uniref:RNA-directed DNA polymerase n=1 Tax=Thermoflavimicrobium daqui TaxID=2137476 RepID=UPI001F0CA3BA|nr:RNA-directed DNA polymerase [Thermoflavimicrobium daqui]